MTSSNRTNLRDDIIDYGVNAGVGVGIATTDDGSQTAVPFPHLLQRRPKAVIC